MFAFTILVLTDGCLISNRAARDGRRSWMTRNGRRIGIVSTVRGHMNGLLGCRLGGCSTYRSVSTIRAATSCSMVYHRR